MVGAGFLEGFAGIPLWGRSGRANEGRLGLGLGGGRVSAAKGLKGVGLLGGLLGEKDPNSATPVRDRERV